MDSNERIGDLFVFWQHHTGTITTYLGDRVEAIRDDGRVKTHRYGGMWVKPVMIVPIEAGELILKTIKECEDAATAELKRIKDTYEAKIKSLVTDVR